jgi:hypothetical protein
MLCLGSAFNNAGWYRIDMRSHQEPSLHLSSRSVQTGANRANGHAERRRNLGVLEVGPRVEQKHVSVRSPQRS